MKKLTMLLFLAIGCTVSTFAQNATKDSQGNYKAISRSLDSTTGKPTGKTYTDAKGTVFPVFISAKGKEYITRISKAGNSYKMYLKL